MTLPLFINRNNRVLMALLCGIAFFFGYTIPNRFHLFPPQLLPLTAFDRSVPLIPWMIFIYCSEYVLFISAYFMFKEDLTRNKYIWGYLGVLLTGALFFTFFPTTYPRNEYPIPLNAHPLIYRLFAAIRAADDPSNCFPSMHVTCCFLTAYAFLDRSEPRLRYWFYFIWSILIAVSTLPTKQHYLADVIGGLILSSAGYWVFFKKVKYVPLTTFVRISRGEQPAQSMPGNSDS